MSDYDFGRHRRVRSLHDFGAGREYISGPLLGGGATQVALLATKLLARTKPNVSKWAGTIATLFGGAISGAMMFSPRHRAAGISGLITAALIGVPRQIEDLMGPAAGATAGYFGVTVPEMEMQGAYDEGMMGLGAGDIELLDAGAGSSGVMGVTVPEQVSGAAPDVELLGGGGFGSNFLAAQ